MLFVTLSVWFKLKAAICCSLFVCSVSTRVIRECIALMDGVPPDHFDVNELHFKWMQAKYANMTSKFVCLLDRSLACWLWELLSYCSMFVCVRFFGVYRYLFASMLRCDSD